MRCCSAGPRVDCDCGRWCSCCLRAGCDGRQNARIMRTESDARLCNARATVASIHVHLLCERDEGTGGIPERGSKRNRYQVTRLICPSSISPYAHPLLITDLISSRTGLDCDDDSVWHGCIGEDQASGPRDHGDQGDQRRPRRPRSRRSVLERPGQQEDDS